MSNRKLPLMNPVLRDFWNTKTRYKVLTGGRGSSKSHDACGRLAYLTNKFKLKIMAVRQFQNKIDDSVYTLLKNKIEAFGYINNFEIQKSKIYSNSGSEFLFYGINRNITEIKSTEDVDILYIEEAHALTKQQWDILKPTIRKNNSEIWIVFNPDLYTDFVYQRFILKTPKNCIVRHINYTENIFATETFLKEAEEAKKEDEEDYNHVYLGEVKMQDMEAFIKVTWIDAAIDAHIKLDFEARGKIAIGYDIADSGDDACSTVENHGNVTIDIDEWQAKEDELEQSAEKVFNKASESDADIIYDCIGVGASAGSTFKRLVKDQKKNIKYTKFDAGDKVENPNREYKAKRKNKDHFENLKAQKWQEIADRLLHTYKAVVKGEPYNEDEIISISSKCKKVNELKKELSAPKKEKSKRGLVKVESKDDLKKRGIASPNCFIAGTKILTSNGEVNIEDLKEGDYVSTPMGDFKIIHTHASIAKVINNRGLTGTAEHKIFTWNKGWVPLQMLGLCDTIEVSKIGRVKWQIMNVFYTKAKCSQFSTRVDIIAREGIKGKMLEMKDFYTEGFGLSIMVKFLTAITFIILMVTGKTTRLKTLKLFNPLNIIESICEKGLKIRSIKKRIKSNLKKLKIKLNFGTNQKRGENGISNTQESYSQKKNTKNTSAKYAKKYSCQEKQHLQKHAQESVQQKEQMREQKHNIPQYAGTAKQNLNMDHLEREINLRDAQKNVPSPSKRTVYNITLEKHNVYYANGVLVKNCADAFIMAHSGVNNKTFHISGG